MFPPLIDVGEGIFTTFSITDTSIQGIAWLLIIILYIFLALIIPINLIYEGITSPNPKDVSPFMMSILSISMFVIGILLTIKGWYIIEAFTGYLDGDVLLLSIFWTGLIASWILNVIIAPITTLIQTQQEG